MNGPTTMEKNQVKALINQRSRKFRRPSPRNQK